MGSGKTSTPSLDYLSLDFLGQGPVSHSYTGVGVPANRVTPRFPVGGRQVSGVVQRDRRGSSLQT